MYGVRASTVRMHHAWAFPRIPSTVSQKSELRPTSLSETLDLNHRDAENDFRTILIPLTPKTTLNSHICKLLTLNA